jgi:phage portal protein BeeE
MSSALAEIRSWADKDLSRRELKRRGSNDAGRIFNSLNGNQYPQQADPEQFQAQTSYAHNTGEAYAAMRPKRQRIAGQPIHVAEVVSARDPDTGKRKGFSNPFKTPGRRELQPEETAILPKWLLAKIGMPDHPELGTRIKLHKSFHSEAARVEILEHHPVLDLLSTPIPRLTQHTLFESTVASLDMTGKCFWWLTDSHDGSRPYDLWYLPSHWIREKPGNAMLDAGYVLSPPFNQMDGVDLPADRVIFFCHPDPANIFMSHSPTRAGVLAVQVDESIRLSQRQFFENSILPWLAVITGDIIDPSGKNLGKAQLERFQVTQMMTRLQHLFQGASKHGRAIILDRAISDIKKISNTANEMDFTESGTYNRQAIWRNYGTPAVVGGDITDANRATALVADEVFTSNIANPEINFLSSIMNDRLLPLFEKGKKDTMVMWIEEAVSSDKDGLRKDLELLAGNGAIVLDEMRSHLGLPPMPNGMGKVRITTAVQILEPIDDEAAAALEVRDEYLPADPVAAKPGEPAKIESDSGKQLLIVPTKDFETAWLKLHGNNERPFAAAVTKLLKTQMASIVKKMEAQTEPFDAAAVFAPRDWDAVLLKLVKPHLLRCAVSGAMLAQNKLKGFRKQDDPTMRLPQRVVYAIKQTLEEAMRKPYWFRINDTTLADLQKALLHSLEDGDTIREQIARVKKVLGDRAAGARGLMIARTESTLGLNAGQHAVIEDMREEGIVDSSEWLTTMDEHARQAHWDANGQKSDKDGNFTVGGELCKYPGDPNLSAAQRINCRCSILGN